MRALASVSALALTGLLAASAPTVSHSADTPRDPPRTCFTPREVDSFAAQDIDVVNIRVRQDYFRINLAEPCPEIQESDRIQLLPRGGGTSFICLREAANAVVVAYSKVTGPRRCDVRTVERLTPTEVAALPRKEKP
jgi:hypothetical protein